MDTFPITSEPTTGSKRNQVPFYICSSLAPSNAQSSQPCFKDHGFELSNLEATQLQYLHEIRSDCRLHHLQLHERCSDLTATPALSNPQSMFMDTEGVYLPQYTGSSSRTGSNRPTRATIDQLCQSFFNEATPGRYPPSLGGARRVDSNVPNQCTCEECETSFHTRPEIFPGPSTFRFGTIPGVTSLDLSDGVSMAVHTRNFEPHIVLEKSGVWKSAGDMRSKVDGSQFPENWFVFEPAEDVLRETALIQASAQTVENEHKSQLKAVNVPNQDCRDDCENLNSKQRRAKPVLTKNQERRSALCSEHLTGTECGPLTTKEIERAMRLKKKAELEFPDDSSEDCIYRAARGCAIHPRSIAERVRRSNIAHRVKILETKLPASIKKARGKRKLYTDEMLGKTILYIKWLQNTIQMLLSHEMTPEGRIISSNNLYLPLNSQMEERRVQYNGPPLMQATT